MASIPTVCASVPVQAPSSTSFRPTCSAMKVSISVFVMRRPSTFGTTTLVKSTVTAVRA